jgi:hypothetical protein
VKRKANGRGAHVEPFPDDRLAPSTPPDARIHLPLEEREATRTVLANGTVLVSYDDPPLDEDGLPPLLADADDPLAELLVAGLSRKGRPKPPTRERGDKWGRLR